MTIALPLRHVAVAVVAAIAAALVAMLAVGEWAIGESGRRQAELTDSLLLPLARIGDLYHAVTRTRLREIELQRGGRERPLAEVVEQIEAGTREVTGLLEGIEQGLPTAGRDELFGIVEQWRRYRVDLDRVTEAAARGDPEQIARYVHFLTGPRYEAMVAQLERLHEDTASRTGAVLERSGAARRRFRWLSLLTAVVGIAAGGIAAAVLVVSQRKRVLRLRRAVTSLGRTGDYTPAALRGADEFSELSALLDASQRRLAEQEQQSAALTRLAERREVERVRDLRRARADLRRERRTCKDLAVAHRLLSDTLAQCPLDLVLLDIRGKVVHASGGYLRREQKRLAEVVGRRPEMIGEDESEASLFAEMWTMVLSGTQWTGPIGEGVDEGGCAAGASLRAIPVRGADGVVRHALLIREAGVPRPPS
ncbi:MAG: hypothetical protein KDG52_21240 [Rhodocyclaceae bacterium]|nr:hypothetical protein [Rhodocyclaceae bacterium]